MTVPATPATDSPAPRLSAVQITGVITAGILSTFLLGQGAAEQEWWEGSPITQQMIFFPSLLPGMISSLVYVFVVARRYPGLATALLLPLAWGLITAFCVGLQWFGIGAIISSKAYFMQISPPPGAILTGLPIPAPIFWTPLIAALLRVISEQTFAPLGDTSNRTLLRRSLIVSTLLVGVIVTIH